MPGPQQAFRDAERRALTRLGAFADPFADAADTEDSGKDYVHIRVQQRNGKKSLTTIQVRSLHAILLAAATRARLGCPAGLGWFTLCRAFWELRELRFVMLASQLADVLSYISSCHCQPAS